MYENDLIFNAQIGRNKTTGINPGCPFCEIDQLTGIIDINEDMILLKNKFSTLQDTSQLVLIESAKHDGEISNYEFDEWLKIFKYAIEKWKQIIATDEYRSVLLYKNFGELSGGTQAHPHMQIIGLKNSDGYAEINESNFKGPIVKQSVGMTVNFSEHPVMGFLEINVAWENDAIEAAADAIQRSVKYILDGYYMGRCKSYNLFFYPKNNGYICKLTPRFVDSPYFIGYKIPQKFNQEHVEELKAEYLEYCQF